MIYIDRNVGSGSGVGNLGPHFQKFNQDYSLTTLDSADACFSGYLDGETINVGIEIKTISEMVQIFKDHRVLSGQVPRMVEQYDVRYFVVEGHWEALPNGHLKTYKYLSRSRIRTVNGRKRKNTYLTRDTRMLYSSFLGVLTAVEMAGVYVRKTTCIEETAAMIRFLYHYFQERNHSLIKKVEGRGLKVAKIKYGDLSFPQYVAMGIPGVNDKIGFEAAKYFGNVPSMAMADFEDWKKVPYVGDVIADQAVTCFEEEHPSAVEEGKDNGV